MRFTPWATRLALTLSLSATALLTACGSGGGSSDTQVRLLNATQSYPALDLTVNDKTINSKVANGAVGEYGGVDTGATATKVLTSDVGTSISTTTPSLISGTNYTYIAYGFSGAIRTSLLQEDQTAPDSGKAKLLVLNLAPDAGALDVYVTASTDSLDTAATFNTGSLNAGAGTGYIQINAGTYRVRVTGATKRSDLRIDIPAVTLDSAGVSTLILTSTNSGTLVNGVQLVQKGAAKAFANTLSRVRAVNALAGSPTVAVSVNSNTLLPASLPPNVGEYISLPAGAANSTVTVNGTAVGVPSQTLAAGGDYTLLVSGVAGSTAAGVWFTDDNRLPTTTGTAKIRLINGLSDPTALATLSVDYTNVVSNVLPGTVSQPQSVNALATGSLITVNSPLKLAPLYNPATGTSTTGLTTLTTGGVYTIFVMGDPNANPVAGKFAKDR
jgi:hypothetical protein